MIDRSEILAVAADNSLAPDVIEKDYVLGWLLAGIFRNPTLASAWHFKGGTCLKKCYFETYRFSEDLDFTLSDRTHMNADFLTEAFGQISAWVYDETGIEIPEKRLRFEVLENPRGGLNCEGRVYYNGPLRLTGSIPRIKLDLTADELLALPATERPVGHPYTDLPEAGIVACCYAYEELFAEKVRALGERTRPRDLYDDVRADVRSRTQRHRAGRHSTNQTRRFEQRVRTIGKTSDDHIDIARDPSNVRLRMHVLPEEIPSPETRLETATTQATGRVGLSGSDRVLGRDQAVDQRVANGQRHRRQRRSCIQLHRGFPDRRGRRRRDSTCIRSSVSASARRARQTCSSCAAVDFCPSQSFWAASERWPSGSSCVSNVSVQRNRYCPRA